MVWHITAGPHKNHTSVCLYYTAVLTFFQNNFVFRRNPADSRQKNFLDSSGLPYPGTQLTEGDPFYWYKAQTDTLLVFYIYIVRDETYPPNYNIIFYASHKQGVPISLTLSLLVTFYDKQGIVALFFPIGTEIRG